MFDVNSIVSFYPAVGSRSFVFIYSYTVHIACILSSLGMVLKKLVETEWKSWITH